MNITNILLAILIVGFILSRQLREHPIREDRGNRTYLILGLIGLIEVGGYVQKIHLNPAAYIIFAASLVIGAGLAALRATNMHLWRDDGKLVSQGNWLTIVLWVVGIGIHLGSDFILGHYSPSAGSLGSESILLYIAISFGVQRTVLLRRAATAIDRQ